MAGTVSLAWHGVSEWNAAMEQLVVRANKACERGANNAAKLVATETKKKLTTTTHRKGTPTPSRPGQPPSLVTGTLRRGVIIVPAKPVGGTAWASQVGPTSVYARVQELGGDTGRAVLPARPYLAPSVDKLIGDGSLWAAFASGWDRF
jgi:hypothetical protein